jgi:hypothetical protein
MKRFKPYTLIFITTLLAGCTNLYDVKKELSRGGFAMWYPPESGIEPGQIWHIQNQVKTAVRDRPAAVSFRTAQLQFATLEKEIDANASLSADFAKGALGNVGALKAKLEAGTVRNVSLNFGKSTAKRLVVGTLLDTEAAGKLTQQYRNDLAKVRAGAPDFVLIAATVDTSGMSYTLEVTNRAAFEANTQGALQGLLGAGLTLDWKSNTKVELKIPDNQTLTVGFSPMKRELLLPGLAPQTDNLSDVEFIKKVSDTAIIQQLQR